VPLLIVRHDMAPMSNKAFCKELWGLMSCVG
jgi:hypothetical protein